MAVKVLSSYPAMQSNTLVSSIVVSESDIWANSKPTQPNVIVHEIGFSLYSSEHVKHQLLYVNQAARHCISVNIISKFADQVLSQMECERSWIEMMHSYNSDLGE